MRPIRKYTSMKCLADNIATFSSKQKQLVLGKWDEVKRMYRRVNDMFGDVVKVTPSSKVVGDMALFMVQNNLSEDDIYEKGETLDFPDSVIERPAAPDLATAFRS